MTTKWMKRTAAVVTMVALLGAGCSSSGTDASGAGNGAGASTTASTTTTAPASGPLDRYADYQTTNYAEPSHWVCRPDVTDICDENLDTTVVKADGTTSVEKFTAARNPGIDCFYVYPTISRDTTPFSDWNASPEEEGYVTHQQAARLASECRVFAPVYRQITLSGLASRLSGDTSTEAPTGDPFADVLDAFKTYMANDNDGRGIVLIGHSQGTGMLNQLIKSEFDPNDDVRAKLVGAYLAGGTVAVPEGKVVGGDFANVPLCTAGDEAGCVTTWASFRSTAPPPANSFFGQPRQGDGVAGCVNPAAPGGDDVDLHAYFPADSSASILSSLGSGDKGSTWLAGPAGDAIDTPFVAVPGLVSGQCASKDGFSYLSVTVHPDPADPRADDIGGDLSPEWGLHLVDVNLVMGDIVARVKDQIATYAG